MEEDEEERRLRQRQEDQFSFWLLAVSFLSLLRIYILFIFSGMCFGLFDIFRTQQL
jgi:hypothetical protein